MMLIQLKYLLFLLITSVAEEVFSLNSRFLKKTFFLGTKFAFITRQAHSHNFLIEGFLFSIQKRMSGEQSAHSSTTGATQANVLVIPSIERVR